MKSFDRKKMSKSEGRAMSGDYSPSKRTQAALLKLEAMDDFCKKENIFFTDNDKIKFQIKQSKGQYKNFKNCINNVFSHV